MNAISSRIIAVRHHHQQINFTINFTTHYFLRVKLRGWILKCFRIGTQKIT